MFKVSSVFWLFLFTASISYGQLFQFDTTIQVFQGEQELTNAFSGGLNAVHLNYLDIDGDDTEELIVFDRSNNVPYVYRKTPEGFKVDLFVRPDLFPIDVQNWLILRDFNGDGLKDIFTHTSFGVRVYQNVMTDEGVTWEIAVDHLRARSNQNTINLLVTSADYPAIDDFDNDGDYDLMVFEFSTGNEITYYKNLSVEEGDATMLLYEKNDVKWADIRECNCNDFKFKDELCDVNKLSKPEHAAPKSITYRNGDLFIGIEGCETLEYLPNDGTFEEPDFNTFTPDFFEISDFKSYPLVFFDDFDGDNVEDAIVANNLLNDGYFLDYNNSIRFFKGPDFQLTQDNFLQSTMIDVGEQAYPVLFDWDGDSDLDLFIGNKGDLNEDGYYGTIQYYENTGFQRAPKFEFRTDDFAGLSSLGFVKLIPKFGDFNDDGNTDMILAAAQADKFFGNLYLLAGNSDNTFESPVSWGFEYARNDIPHLYDYDEDGVLDIFLGKSFGTTDFYRNNGTNALGDFELTTRGILNVTPDGYNLNATLAFFDLNKDGNSEIIKSDARGVLEIYQSFDNLEDPIFENRIDPTGSDVPTTFDFGFHNYLSFGDLYNNGQIFGFIGTFNGGINVIKLNSDDTFEETELLLFPNPVARGEDLRIYSSKDQKAFVTDLAGNMILDAFDLAADEEFRILVNDLRTGIYILKGEISTAKFYVE